MLRLAFDFIIAWREIRTRPNAYEHCSESRHLSMIASFLPSSFHLLLKLPADRGSGCEGTSCHPPFSLLLFVKLLLAFELFR